MSHLVQAKTIIQHYNENNTIPRAGGISDNVFDDFLFSDVKDTNTANFCTKQQL